MVETPMFLVNIRDLTPADALSMLILREEAVEKPLMGPLSRFQGPKAHQGAGAGAGPLPSPVGLVPPSSILDLFDGIRQQIAVPVEACDQVSDVLGVGFIVGLGR
jgi:hypothetical protein